jgi:hypothetical protein
MNTTFLSSATIRAKMPPINKEVANYGKSAGIVG